MDDDFLYVRVHRAYEAPLAGIRLRAGEMYLAVPSERLIGDKGVVVLECEVEPAASMGVVLTQGDYTLFDADSPEAAALRARHPYFQES